MNYSIESSLRILRNADLGNEMPDLQEAAKTLTGEDFPASKRQLSKTNIRSTTKPALKSLTKPLLEELRSTLASDPGDSDVDCWAQKLLRVCEVRKSSLRERLLEQQMSTRELQQKTLALVCFFLKYFDKSRDARFVNVALKLVDQRWLLHPDKATKLADGNCDSIACLTLACNILLDKALFDLENSDVNNDVKVELAAITDSTNSYQPIPCTTNKSVIVFSPSRFSLYSMASTEMLVRNGVKIEAIVVRRLFNPRRAVSEFRRDGKRLIKKVWNKLVLRKRAYKAEYQYKTLPQVLESLSVAEKSLDELAARHGIPVVYCNTLNDDVVHKQLEASRPDAVVFTGGGILREKTLSLAGDGVLNCHIGQLPHYRGMDVVEWPLLENRVDSLGFTVHFMAKGIDTGDILNIFPIGIDLASNITDLRRKCEAHMSCAMVQTVTRFLNGQCPRFSQSSKDGKQYFIIHERLREIAERRLEKAIRETAS